MIWPTATPAVVLLVLGVIAAFVGLGSFNRVRKNYGWSAHAATRYSWGTLFVAMGLGGAAVFPPGRALIPVFVLLFIALQATPAVLRWFGLPRRRPSLPSDSGAQRD